MSALKQYIDLFQAHRTALEAGSVPALNALRDRALAALSGASLPRKGQEDYEATDLEQVFAPDYGVNVNRTPVTANPAETFHCDVPNLSTRQYYFFNDTFATSPTAANTADGVVVESFAQAQRNHPDVLSRYLGQVAPLERPEVALNTLLAQDGMLVLVPDGTVAQRAIQLVNILSARQPVMAVRRILVVVGRNAQARLLVCDHTQGSGVDCLASQVVEVVALEGSTFDYYDLEESSKRTRRVCTVAVDQRRGSNVLVDGMTLTNGLTRNDYLIDVNGERCETHLLGMTIATGEQHVDNHTFISHNAPRCTSREMFKYVLNDQAVGAFAGKILVKPDCPQTDAYQGNRNLCASPDAKMYTKPQLEIYTDDVRCSHGAAVGQLDDEALFYMRTRGIPLPEARMMLMQAFMADVIDGVRLEPLRDRLHHLVEKRFAGQLATCGNCPAACRK